MEGIDVLGATLMAVAHLTQTKVLLGISLVCDGIAPERAHLGNIWLLYLVMVLILGWAPPMVSANYQLELSSILLWIGTLALCGRMFVRTLWLHRQETEEKI